MFFLIQIFPKQAPHVQDLNLNLIPAASEASHPAGAGFIGSWLLLSLFGVENPAAMDPRVHPRDTYGQLWRVCHPMTDPC